MNSLFKYRYVKKEIIIRPYKPSDSISEITELLHKSYKQLADLGFRYLATHQDDHETEKRLIKGISYLALDGKKIISTVSLYHNNSESYNCNWYQKKNVAHFGQFGVLPEYQKEGIGNYMMDLIEAKAKELGETELALDTAEGAVHLINFYKRRGYRFIEYVDWDVTNYRSVIMSKKL